LEMFTRESPKGMAKGASSAVAFEASEFPGLAYGRRAKPRAPVTKALGLADSL
jgi:hypothetical protein